MIAVLTLIAAFALTLVLTWLAVDWFVRAVDRAFDKED